MMMCLLALLTLLGGLFLLGYSKKEGLGKFTKLASYLAITFSTIVFVVGLIGLMACPSKCGSGHCSKNASVEKCIVMKKECKMNGKDCKMDMEECHKNMGSDCKDSGSCKSDMKCSAEMMKSCPKGEGCNTPEECAAKMKEMGCDDACMKKCEKEKGKCDGDCKTK